MLQALCDDTQEEFKLMGDIEDFLHHKAYIVTLKSETDAAQKVYTRSSHLKHSVAKNDQISVGMASQFHSDVEKPLLTAHEITVNILYYRFLRLRLVTPYFILLSY